MPRISQLPSLTTADNTDEIAIVDVSASTTKKITRGDLLKAPLPTKSVTLPAINGGTTAGVLTTDASGNVSVAGNYSTSEVSTNTTWIDGKTVYKKTINFGSLPNNTTKDVNHNITGLSQLIEVTGTATYSSGARFPLPFVASSLGAQIQIIVTDTAISITTGSDRSGATAYVTLLYTKA